MDSQEDSAVLQHLLFQVAAFEDNPDSPILRSLAGYGIRDFTTLVSYKDVVYKDMYYNDNTGAVLKVKPGPTKVLQMLVRYLHYMIMDNGGALPPVADLMQVTQNQFIAFGSYSMEPVCMSHLKESFPVKIAKDTLIGSSKHDAGNSQSNEEHQMSGSGGVDTPTLGHVDGGDAFAGASSDPFCHGLPIPRNMIRRARTPMDIQANLLISGEQFHASVFLTFASHTQWDPGTSYQMIGILRI